MTLAGKHALVTGGTSGIGRAIVLDLVDNGAFVTFCGRSEARGAELEESLDGNGRFWRADVTSPDDIRSLFGAAGQQGALDIMVNNAAEAELGTLPDITYDTLAKAMWSVFGSVVMLTQSAAEAMRGTGGSIVNIGSTAAHRANSSPPVYSSLKAAVSHLTRCLALELAPQRVRVNTVSPGAIATPIFQDRMNLLDLSPQQAAPLIEHALASVNPSGLSGTVDDIARAVRFFADDANPYITGQDLVVDGGLTSGNTPLARAAEWSRIAEVLTDARSSS